MAAVMLLNLSPRLAGYLVLGMVDVRARLARDSYAVPQGWDELQAMLTNWARTGQDGTALAQTVELAEAESITTKLLVSYPEAAQLLTCSDRTVKRLVASGELPAVHIGGSARVRVTDLQNYTASLSSDRETRSA